MLGAGLRHNSAVLVRWRCCRVCVATSGRRPDVDSHVHSEARSHKEKKLCLRGIFTLAHTRWQSRCPWSLSVVLVSFRYRGWSSTKSPGRLGNGDRRPLRIVGGVWESSVVENNANYGEILSLVDDPAPGAASGAVPLVTRFFAGDPDANHFRQPCVPAEDRKSGCLRGRRGRGGKA